ncbi:MAG TPA: glycosyltransferase [Pseudonocardiaceae bacterium]|jgi:glycosyltransferase involved in cell wall biosynthesis|nr:glycosyltransferase [Pseudonocardiaceae bacterium]
MRVILFGTYDATTHPRASIIAAGLRAHGMSVQECNAPLGLSTSARVDMLVRPWRAVFLVLRLVRCWARLIGAALRLSTPDVVLVGYLGHFDVHLARLLFPRATIVLDHLVGAADTARDRRLDSGFRPRLLRLIDEAALRAADVVVVDTLAHQELLAPRHRTRSVVVGVGAPAEWFDVSGPDEAEGPLRVVFYGLYTPLQGTPVIGAALSRLRRRTDLDVEVTMIGTGQDSAETRALAGSSARVRWLDWVAADELPALVAGHHVCLGIFGTGGKAHRVVPNKVFQGAAAGCAIITSDTEPQRRILGSAALLVPPGDPTALATALARLATDRAELHRLRRAARQLADDHFTEERIAEPLVSRLDPARVAVRSR